MKDMEAEARARDAALDLLEYRRANLITAGRFWAMELAKTRIYVTAPMVREAMERAGYDLSGIDPRWMGAVFRAGSGWRRVGRNG